MSDKISCNKIINDLAKSDYKSTLKREKKGVALAYNEKFSKDKAIHRSRLLKS